MWAGLFSLTDCGLIHLRNKEDWINPVVAGFVAGGFLAIRGILKRNKNPKKLNFLIISFKLLKIISIIH